jgi:phage tail sheath protein FI
MRDWVSNTAIYTLWKKIDKPMNRRLVDSVVDAMSSWINGLYGAEYIYGGRIEFRSDENTEENILKGIIKVHIYIAFVSPAQEIDIPIEYDPSYISAALAI